MKHLIALSGILLLSPHLSSAASGNEGPENYRLELSATLWRLNSNGTIHADGSPINFFTDLGVSQRQRIYDGRLTWRLKHKLRFVMEGTPISIHGLSTTTHTVTYFGQQYSFSETLKSSANISYIYAGLHRDFYNGRFGRFGSSIGAAYLGLSGNIDAEQSGINKHGHSPFGLPFGGIDFRIYPIPNRRWVAVEGALRGLPAGAYGHWVEATGGLGTFVGPVGFQLGYREILIDFHQTGANPNGLDVRFSGPLATVFWNW